MAPRLRLSINVLRVVRALTDAGPEDRYGYALMRATALPSGGLYPVLARLEAAGWVTPRPEADPPDGRPPRTYYDLTATGVAEAEQALAPFR